MRPLGVCDGAAELPAPCRGHPHARRWRREAQPKVSARQSSPGVHMRGSRRRSPASSGSCTAGAASSTDASGAKEDFPLYSELENHLQGTDSPPDRGLLPSNLQEAEGTSLTGMWLNKTDVPMSLLGMDISPSEPPPGSPPRSRSDGGKKTTVLSPASPLDTGCWSPAPTNKPLKKIKHTSVLGPLSSLNDTVV